MSQSGQPGQAPYGSPPPSQVPPGWYPDPAGHGQRWWDGVQWTQGVQWGPGPLAAPATNGLAIASLVLGIVWLGWVGSILAVIFGHIALSQIHTRREGGRGLAIAGLVLGYIGVATLVLVIALGIANSGNGGSSVYFGPTNTN